MRHLIAFALAFAPLSALAGEFQIQPATQFSINPAVVVSDPSASTCFVWRHSGGYGQAGTGTVIACEDGRSLVITNAHVVEGTNAPTVVINAGRQYPASILAVARTGPGSGEPDLALVVVDGELPPSPIAESEPTIGERVRMWGFGGRMGFQGAALKMGQFLGHLFNDQSNASMHTISGDSGSGWFNDLGELVGVHWGNDGRAWAVPLKAVRGFVKERARGIFPRLAQRLEDRKAAREKPAPKKPEPAPKPKEKPASFEINPASSFAAPSAPACAGGSCPTYSAPRRRLLRW